MSVAFVSRNAIEMVTSVTLQDVSRIIRAGEIILGFMPHVCVS